MSNILCSVLLYFIRKQKFKRKDEWYNRSAVGSKDKSTMPRGRISFSSFNPKQWYSQWNREVFICRASNGFEFHISRRQTKNRYFQLMMKLDHYRFYWNQNKGIMGGGNKEIKQSHTADEEVALSGVKEFISFHFHFFISRDKKKRKYPFINSSNCTYTCR